MIKVSVVCNTARPGYIDTICESLSSQTMSQKEWELILVDDLHKQRHKAVREYLRGKIKNFKHISPRQMKDFFAACTAMNTGIIHSRGELVFFMNDYLYPPARCLERHWEIYSKHGPKIIIHGPLIDGIVASGRSVWQGAPAEPRLIIEEGQSFYFWDLTPPIAVPLKAGFETLTEETAISIFAQPFQPMPFLTILPDWRTGATMGELIDDGLHENRAIHPWSWWWGGRNTSAPMEALLEINGWDELFDGRHGGADGDIGSRLMNQAGCRYLVDIKEPCYELIHPVRKKGVLSEEERNVRVEELRQGKELPNDYSLREERERILGGAT